MAARNYEDALKRVLEHEGGYTNDAADPGGPTNWGITIADARMYWKTDATAADVRSMPLDVAKTIYRGKYWAAVRGDDLPDGLDYAVFDYGVNSGVGRAAKVLRRLLKLPEGDAINNDVLAAVKQYGDTRELIDRLCDERLEFLQGLRTWGTFGRGWGRRVREVRAASLEMAARPLPTAPPTKGKSLLSALLSLLSRWRRATA